MAPPPSSQITPPPVPFAHHRRADSESYIPSSDLLSAGTTWVGRENQWDLPYFPLWNKDPSYSCPNNCLWGNAESVDNYVNCQNDKSCICEPDTLSTAVVWAEQCVEKKCVGKARPGDGVGYVQTLLVEVCGNAWREEGRTVEFEIPKTVTGGVDVRGTTWTGISTTGATNTDGQSQETTSADSPTSSSSDESSDSNNNIALKAGLGAGIPIFILLLIGFALLYIQRRRSQKSGNITPQEVMGDIPSPPPPPLPVDHYASGEWNKYFGHHTPQQQQQHQLWIPPVEMSGRRSIAAPSPPEQEVMKFDGDRSISPVIRGDESGGMRG